MLLCKLGYTNITSRNSQFELIKFLVGTHTLCFHCNSQLSLFVDSHIVFKRNKAPTRYPYRPTGRISMSNSGLYYSAYVHLRPSNRNITFRQSGYSLNYIRLCPRIFKGNLINYHLNSKSSSHSYDASRSYIRSGVSGNPHGHYRGDFLDISSNGKYIGNTRYP